MAVWVPPRLTAAVLGLFGQLAPDTSARLGAALGGVVFHWFGWLKLTRRAVVRKNLRLALGLRGTRRRMAAERSFQTMFANFIEIWSAQHPDHAMLRKAHVWQPTVISELIQRYGTVVMITAHLGQWDLGPSSVAMHYPHRRALCIATPQRAELIDRLLNDCRARLMMEIVLVKGDNRRGPLRCLRGLKEGYPVGLLADQRPHLSLGSPCYFLGQPTKCHHGPAMMAQRAGKPLLPGVCIRLSASRSVVVVGRPILPEGLSHEEIQQRAFDTLSAFIAYLPSQYFWHHDRFKSKRPTTIPWPNRAPWRTQGIAAAFKRREEPATDVS